MKRTAALFIIATLAAGCTQFPDLDFTQTDAVEAADFPALVPIEPILARVGAPGPDPTVERGALDARLAGLRARAERLRNAGLSPDERRKLDAGLR